MEPDKKTHGEGMNDFALYRSNGTSLAGYRQALEWSNAGHESGNSERRNPAPATMPRLRCARGKTQLVPLCGGSATLKA